MTLTQSCPQGLTEQDLAMQMTEEQYTRFGRWMNGQTMSVCDGRSFHFERGPCGDPFPDGNMGEFIPRPPHENYEDHTWACGYLPGGYYEMTECAYAPHGGVYYRWDVERFLRGWPIVDW